MLEHGGRVAGGAPAAELAIGDRDRLAQDIGRRFKGSQKSAGRCQPCVMSA